MLVGIYIELPLRTTAELESFLDNFLPNRKLGMKEIAVLRGQKLPAQIFTSLNEVLPQLCDDFDLECYVSWRNNDPQAPVHDAAVFFTPDGGLIGAVYVDEGQEKTWITKVISLYPDMTRLTLLESSPPRTLMQFRELSQRVCNKDKPVRHGGISQH